MKVYYTVDEAAEYLGTGVRFLRRLIAERRIPFHKVGKFVRIKIDDLGAFSAGRPLGGVGRGAGRRHPRRGAGGGGGGVGGVRHTPPAGGQRGTRRAGHARRKNRTPVSRYSPASSTL